MNAPAPQLDPLVDNPYFEPLGHEDGDLFVTLKSSGSSVRFIGRPTHEMLSWVAPASWWRSNWSQRGRGTTALQALERACQRQGLFPGTAIAEKKLAAAKRAAQPAPTITANGHPAAFVLRETKTHFYVLCPFCGAVHTHGTPDLGTRLAPCARHYDDVADYEIVRDGPVRGETPAAAAATA
jgi:hypothetical protein